MLRLAKRLREALCFTRLTILHHPTIHSPNARQHSTARRAQTPPNTMSRQARIPSCMPSFFAGKQRPRFWKRRPLAAALPACQRPQSRLPSVISRHRAGREREVSNPRAAICWSRSRWPCTCPGRWLPIYVKRLLSNSAGVVHQVRFHSALAPSPFRATSSLLPALPAPIRRIWLDLKPSSRRNPAGAEPQPFS